MLLIYCQNYEDWAHTSSFVARLIPPCAQIPDKKDGDAGSRPTKPGPFTLGDWHIVEAGPDAIDPEITYVSEYELR